MDLFARLKSVFIEAPVLDETVWHKRLRAPPFARTINGNPISYGQIWRRKRNGEWEYQQDEETIAEIETRIW